MNIRNAKILDVKAINGLITYYAELDRMLFRSMADIYENIQIFKVAEIDGQIVGCCALQVVWADLAEIKSLSVAKEHFGKGIGRELVKGHIEGARKLGIPRIFTLTMEPDFFEKLGFVRIDRQNLPMKVWSDCAKCPKQDHCDEIAMIYHVESDR